MGMRRLFINKSVRLLVRNEQLFDSSRVLLRCRYSSESCVQAKEEKSRLFDYLRAQIKACGPITVADYMKQALTHPTEGYYMKKDVFGSQGDFITSPEISQLFGEMIGIWILSEWRKISRHPLQLVELGPGRGTLSKDVLRVFKQLKVGDKLSIHLVEISPALSAIQAKNLCTTSEEVQLDEKRSTKHYREGVTEDGNKVFWYHSVKDVPRKFSAFVAHEFFDALPIHKFQKNNGEWSEVFVDIDPNDEEKFRYVLSKSPTLSTKLFIDMGEKRSHIEVSPESLLIVDYLATFMQECGGFALIADYGYDGDKSDTFRAFKAHKQQDPLVNPGSADLTADVDFSRLRNVATKDDRTIVFGPVEQREFLLQLGIDVRLKMLMENISDDDKKELESGYHMIIDEDKMGKCFKIFSIFPAVLKEHLTMWPVAGFYDATEVEKPPTD